MTWSILLTVAFLGCGGDSDAETDPSADTEVPVYVAQVVNPDERCRRDEEVPGPASGSCDDVVAITMSADGTCWRFGCSWEGMPFAQGTGGSGPPADPDWCADGDWFSAQPACGAGGP